VSALPTKRLLPRERGHIARGPRHLHGKDSAGCIDKSKALARTGYGRCIIRNAHPRSRAVPRQHHVGIEINFGEVGKLTVRASVLRHPQFQLFSGINVPVLAERLEVDAVHIALAQQIPHGHLEGGGVTAGDNGNFVVSRQRKGFLKKK
jgi:hypothetical protein